MPLIQNLTKQMKHKLKHHALGRTANHRLSLLKQLSSDLLLHNSITTTTAKAKDLRRYLEPLITEAKHELDLHRRRRLLAKLRHADDLEPLLDIAEQNKERNGGYLRLTKLPSTRHDNAPTVRIDFVANDSKS